MIIVPPGYKLSLRFFHPNIDPLEITQELSMTPAYYWKQGDPRKTSKGKSLDGVYTESYWCFPYEIPQNGVLSDFLQSCVNRLSPYHVFFDKISDEKGRCEFYIQISGNINSGDELEWSLLGQLAKLKFNLAIEVFPMAFSQRNRPTP